MWPRLDFSLLPLLPLLPPKAWLAEHSLNSPPQSKPGLRLCSSARGSQSGVPAPPAAAAPGNLLEMRILWAQPLCLHSPLGDADPVVWFENHYLENGIWKEMPILGSPKARGIGLRARRVLAEFLPESLARRCRRSLLSQGAPEASLSLVALATVSLSKNFCPPLSQASSGQNSTLLDRILRHGTG